jgi:hypothetical protein
MNDTTDKHLKLPEKVAAIKECSFVIWSTANDLSAEFMQHFDDVRIPVVGIRHVRQWGVQVDDERELSGHERTSIEDEELWEIVLEAKDGSNYEVNSRFVDPAPDI